MLSSTSITSTKRLVCQHGWWPWPAAYDYEGQVTYVEACAQWQADKLALQQGCIKMTSQDVALQLMEASLNSEADDIVLSLEQRVRELSPELFNSISDWHTFRKIMGRTSMDVWKLFEKFRAEEKMKVTLPHEPG